jgi:hypothetical protein
MSQIDSGLATNHLTGNRSMIHFVPSAVYASDSNISHNPYRSILIRLELSQQQLVSDLIYNPQLDQIVRQICLHGAGGDYHYTTKHFTKRFFKTADSAITAPPKLKKAIFYDFGHAQAMQACILLLTPRVRVLDLDNTPNMPNLSIIRWYENEQVCNLLLAECCPELCRVDITRITGLVDIESNRFEITSELGDGWHMERTPDEEAWNGIGTQLHTAIWKC